MAKFLIEPHFRLQEWVAEEKDYFRTEGLDYEFRELVRTTDGNIVVLGGLMKVQLDNSRNGIPGLDDAPLIGGAFRNSATGTTKRELVILIKPTIIQSDKNWEQDIQDSRGRMQGMGDDPRTSPADRKQ